MDTFRIVVISDTHKDFLSLRKIAERHIQNADLFIHLGDLEEDVKKLKALYPNLPVRQVRGNCDFGSKLKTVDTVEVGGVKIFFCHGHTMMVGSGTGLLEEAAREAGCKIALFGHTHVSCCRYQEGLYVMNPVPPPSPGTAAGATASSTSPRRGPSPMWSSWTRERRGEDEKPIYLRLPGLRRAALPEWGKLCLPQRAQF